jgi:hypothetical protein
VLGDDVVHFLRYDVGTLADGAAEELRLLEGRGADLLEAVAAADVARDALQPVPLADVLDPGVRVFGRVIGLRAGGRTS